MDRTSTASSAMSTAAHSEAHGRSTPLRRPVDRSRGKHSPTRLCTPPDLSLFSDHSSAPPAAASVASAAAKPTVKDLVHFYESPVKQRGSHFIPPPPASLVSSYQTEYDENSFGDAFDVETGRRGRAVSDASRGSRARAALDWPADSAGTVPDEEISDSETGSVLQTPSGNENDSGGSDDDDDVDVALLETQTRAMWRAIARYRRLNMALVASLLLLFLALVAYMSFTVPNMGLRGSYYREAVWIVMYATMAALFTTLRVAVVMLDEQQDWYDKRMFYAKCLRRLARRSRRQAHRR